MTTSINLKRLWILLTLVWCGAVLIAFGLRVGDDYRSARHSYESAVGSQVRTEWHQCLRNIGSDPWLKYSEECRRKVDVECKDPMWRESCSKVFYEGCIQSKEPRCLHILTEHQKRFLEKSAWAHIVETFGYFATSSYSKPFWLETTLLLFGPLAFWLAPRFWFTLKNWLYANQPANSQSHPNFLLNQLVRDDNNSIPRKESASAIEVHMRTKWGALMKIFYPHIGLFFSLVAILVFGVLTNSALVGAFFGALAAASIDPLLAIGAILIGGLSGKQKLLLPIAIAFAILFSVYIVYINASLGAKLDVFSMLVRIVAVVAIAYIANAVRMLIAMRQAKSG